jgi:hypothetical protein
MAVQGSTVVPAAGTPDNKQQGEGSILSMMLDTVGLEVHKNNQQGSVPATSCTVSGTSAVISSNQALQGSTAQDAAAVQQLVAELEAARQKCEELTLENIK